MCVCVCVCLFGCVFLCLCVCVSVGVCVLYPDADQEALAFRRPEFVSRSRERVKRLCLLKVERRVQAEFSRERETLFNHPPLTRRYTHNTAGTHSSSGSQHVTSRHNVPLTPVLFLFFLLI